MRTTSNKVSAIGAVALTVLIACSPPIEQPPGNAKAQAAQTEAVKVPPGTVAVPPPPPSEPGYSGVWAASSADCTDSVKTYLLSGDALSLTPQSRNCAVKSLAEEHPTGRSVIYRITAVCISNPPSTSQTVGVAQPSGEDTITLSAGASDTVMQMQVGIGAPMTLERCPTAPTP